MLRPRPELLRREVARLREALLLLEPPVLFRRDVLPAVARRGALLASPTLRRCLAAVRAAISLVRRRRTPRGFSDPRTCSSWRTRFWLFTPRGGMHAPVDGDHSRGAR